MGNLKSFFSTLKFLCNFEFTQGLELVFLEGNITEEPHCVGLRKNQLLPGFQETVSHFL